MHEVLIWEILHADDVPLEFNMDVHLRILVDPLSNAYREFGLNIFMKKTEIMAQCFDIHTWEGRGKSLEAWFLVVMGVRRAEENRRSHAADSWQMERVAQAQEPCGFLCCH